MITSRDGRLDPAEEVEFVDDFDYDDRDVDLFGDLDVEDDCYA